MIVDVIDLNFDNLNFKKSYDRNRMNKGRILFERQCVDIDEVEKIDKDNYRIKAIVEGNTSYYDVTLNLYKNMVEEYTCDCKDFESGNICKHICATCLEVIRPHRASTEEGRIRLYEEERKRNEEYLRKWRLEQEEERKRREYELKYYNALKIINNYKDINENNNDYNLKKLYKETRDELVVNEINNSELASNIIIEPRVQLQGENSIGVSFKIGQTTKYVLKDICEFCRAFDNEELLYYGKKLNFIAKKENIQKDDWIILDYILDYGEILKYSQKTLDNYSGYYYRNYTISQKELNLFENKIDDFFDIIKERAISISFGTENNIYTFSKEKINIKLEFKKEKSDYILKLNLDNYYYLLSKKKIYIFSNQKIYEYYKDSNKEMINVLRLLNYDNEILIPKDRIKEFSEYVFPNISNYLEIGNSIKNVKEAVLVDKLASKMYLDLDNNDNIIMELKFCYKDFEFNILDKMYEKDLEEKNIVRNAIEEKNVLTRIFKDGFEIINGRKYFTLKEEDAIYDFLVNKVENYMNDFEILVTDKFKNKEIKKPRISSISVKLDNGLLELDLSKIDFDINEIKDVLKNYNIKKKYYKLKNGDFLNLEQSSDLDLLNEMSNSFDIDYNKMETGIIKLPVNRSLYLEQLLNKNKNINTNKDDGFNQLVNNIENKNISKNIKIDKNFENVLREYQKTGYKWLKVLQEYGLGGILADDMGLGKTLQVIALLSTSKKTSIVVCPSSLVLNWKSEIEKWCPKINVCIIRGDANTRKELINLYDNYNLLVTSYDILKRDVFEYEGKKFEYVIADEAQYIKNFNTQNATALKSLNGQTRFALTGTPIENSLSELWSIFDFVMPGYLYSYSKFKKKLEEPIIKEDTEALNRLKTLINPFILRRIKKDVLTELPEKSITVMKNEMTDEQNKLYISYLAQTKKEIAEELNENGFEKSKFKILMLLTRLRQICCHPGLFISNYKGESGKLNQCIDLIIDAIDSGHKILLFSSYTSMFEIIERKLNENNIVYSKLTGETSVNKRVEMVEQFNKDENIKIFLISLKAGGTGLNLTGADVVIHYDPWWNVSSENQATDRAYRIGQKNSVQVFKLITTNSIEEKINNLQEKKAKLSEQLLNTEEKFINKLSKEEIMSLFE